MLGKEANGLPLNTSKKAEREWVVEWPSESEGMWEHEAQVSLTWEVLLFVRTTKFKQDSAYSFHQSLLLHSLLLFPHFPLSLLPELSPEETMLLNFISAAFNLTPQNGFGFQYTLKVFVSASLAVVVSSRSFPKNRFFLWRRNSCSKTDRKYCPNVESEELFHVVQTDTARNEWESVRISVKCNMFTKRSRISERAQRIREYEKQRERRKVILPNGNERL